MSDFFSSLPEQVLVDFNTLLNIEISFAQQMLKEHGGFFPFGAVVKSDGKCELISAYPGESSLHSGQAHIDMMINGFQKQAQEKLIRSCCYCTDVRFEIPNKLAKTDAILVNLEHAFGDAINVYIPYKKRLFRGYQYGPQYIMDTIPIVFKK